MPRMRIGCCDPSLFVTFAVRGKRPAPSLVARLPNPLQFPLRSLSERENEKCHSSTRRADTGSIRLNHFRAHEFDGGLPHCYDRGAGWSSLVARWAHNPKVGGSNPPPATNAIIGLRGIQVFDCGPKWSCKLRNAKTEAVHETAFCYLV